MGKEMKISQDRYYDKLISTHMSLDHFHSFFSDLGDGSRDVHHLLFLYLLQDVVDDNECTCATHTSAGYKEEKIFL